jgi:hypothetical protein
MLKELLGKWAELEWDRCQRDSEGMFSLRGGRKTCGHCLNHQDPRWHDFGDLQRDVQAAIAAHHLRCKLENYSEGWSASLLSADQTQRFEGVDTEPAIALLSVYVQWLETKAIGGAA